MQDNRAPLLALDGNRHIPRSQSGSSVASTRSTAGSPILWFSPTNSNGTSVDWSRPPSRKGKERAIEETPTRSSKRLRDLESCDDNRALLLPAFDGLGIGLDVNTQTYTRSINDSPTLFRRRSRLDLTKAIPILQTHTHGMPEALESATSSASYSSDSSIPFSALLEKKSNFDYLDRLRIASSPNRRRRKDSDSLGTAPTSSSYLRPVVLLLLLAGTFMLVGFAFSPSSAPESILLNPAPILLNRPQPSSSSSYFRLALTRFFRPFRVDDSAADLITANFRESPERDTLVLYRILGNDLPPRHVLGQTLQNLRFMLEQESKFDTLELLADNNLSGIRKVEKYFVLNRISSVETLNAIRALLTEFGILQSRILYIPFEWQEYERREIRWDGGVAEAAGVWNIGRPGERLVQVKASENQTLAAVAQAEAEDLPTKTDKRKLTQGIGRLRAIDFTYHDKNLYAINNNGGRNYALRHGRSLSHARWILPLDGNCFFTPPAMLSLVNTLESHGEGEGAKSYAVIPMARLLDNQALLPLNNDLTSQISSHTPLKQGKILNKLSEFAPHAPEEPQIGFRFDSTEYYQLGMRYGRRSKLELLWRLGAVPRSRNLDRRTLPWEQADREHLTAESFASIKTRVKDTNQVGFINGGWVYRLFSGDQKQEIPSKEANSLRNMNRIRGIVGFLERLDEMMTRGEMCRGAINCGFHRNLTWTWDLEALKKMKEQYNGGQSGVSHRVQALRNVALRVQYDLEASIQHSASILSTAPASQVVANISSMALAGFLTDSEDLAKSAAQLVLLRFLPTQEIDAFLPTNATNVHGDGVGYTFPFLPDTSPPPWSRLLSTSLPSKAADFDFSILLDALRLIKLVKPGLLPQDQINTFLSKHLAYLLSNSEQLQLSELPHSAEDAANYDIQIAALAAYLDDVRLVNRVKNRSRLRSQQQQLDSILEAGLRNVRAIEGVEDFRIAL